MSKNIIFGDTARTLWEEGLYFMKLRRGWEFDEETAKALGDLFAKCGMNIALGLGSITDNAYINGSYGRWEDLSESEEERIREVEKGGGLLYSNEKIFIEYI